MMTRMEPLFDTAAPALTGRFAEVAIERGIDAGRTGLTYSIPESLADLAVGQRVFVPLGKSDKPAPGYVVRLTPSTTLRQVKPILRRDPHGITLPPDLIHLALWMADYYVAPLGMVLATMLPASVKRATGLKSEIQIDLTSLRTAVAPTDVKLPARQQAILALAQRLAQTGAETISPRALADEAGARTIGPVKNLIARHLLPTVRRQIIHAPEIFPGPAPQAAAGRPAGSSSRIADDHLTDAQRDAIAHLADEITLNRFSVHLLHGVTGSGKTEVYLRAIEHLLQADPSAPGTEHAREIHGGTSGSAKDSGAPPGAELFPGVIVLVPEIALTPQTVARFTERFGSVGVAVLHSGLTAAQRHEQWQRLRAGAARIVIGARSAVFAPLPRLGLMIVDEEHEPSYKQDQVPRYHARDVAVMRARLAGVPVILGSATPSLESYHNATHVPADGGAPRYHLLRLPERVAGQDLPEVRIVDLNQERRKRYSYTGGAGIHLLSLQLEAQLQRTLQEGGQAMLLLNRRGYANYISCPDHRCGWLLQCDHCDVLMVYHKSGALPRGGVVRCHHCLAEQLLPELCPVCGKRVTVFGMGTQRIEEELGKKFPQARLARMDSDTMRTARDYQHTLERFRAGELDVLVGTQMIAKGLDFPNVRLVGVISADTALNLPDFRSSERTFQMLAQVAGRAGRSGHGGLVIVQTFNPDDPTIRDATHHDYERFARRELEVRRRVGLPPITRLARLVVRHPDPGKCEALAEKLAAQLGEVNRLQGERVKLRGPAPCPIARIAGFHRRQIELLAPDARMLQRLLAQLRQQYGLRADAQVAVDVDPVSLL